MKYHCKHCGSIFEPGYSAVFPILHGGRSAVKCMACELLGQTAFMKPIPDYETPSQYKKRMGNPYPDKGLVWNNRYPGGGPLSNWNIDTFGYVRKEKSFPDKIFVIASPPVPPPDDFVPEGNE